MQQVTIDSLRQSLHVSKDRLIKNGEDEGDVHGGIAGSSQSIQVLNEC